MISSELSALGRLGDALHRAVTIERLSPSYLFEGPDAEVAHRLALAFAATILGAGLADEARARSDQQVEAGTHPDLHVQRRDKATVISVQALGALLEEAHGTPVVGAHQVFLLDPAEAMEPEGIARYLKALEEPPRGTVFLLVTSRPDRLPETVLSRVRRVRVPPPTREEIADRLVRDGVDANTATALARWSGGSLARARRLAASQAYEVARGLADAAASRSSRAGAAAEGGLSMLTRAAAEAAEADTDDAAVDRKREHLRRLLADVLYVLSIEARDRAAEREATWLDGATPDDALDLFEQLGALTVAVRQNVTPAVILLETVRVLRRALVKSA